MSLKNDEINAIKTQLEQKAIIEENYQNKLQALEIELKSKKVALSGKNDEFDKLNNLLKTKEDEFNNKIAEKNAEIAGIQTDLTDREKELERMKYRSFWQQLKACFRNQ